MTTAPDEPFTWTDREVCRAAGYVFGTLAAGLTLSLCRMFNANHIAHRATHPLRLFRR